MPAIQRHWTAAAVRELIREDRPWPRYELIDGELLVTPGPRDEHQHAVLEISILLNDYLSAHPFGVTMISPSDVALKPETITQPDVYVVPAFESVDGTVYRWPDVTALVLAVEVLSPGSLRADRITKRDFYLDNGVAEYWIIDLDAQVVERWRQLQLTPELLRDEITWAPRSGARLTIDLAALFDRVRAKQRLTEGWREKK